MKSEHTQLGSVHYAVIGLPSEGHHSLSHHSHPVGRWHPPASVVANRPSGQGYSILLDSARDVAASTTAVVPFLDWYHKAVPQKPKVETKGESVRYYGLGHNTAGGMYLKSSFPAGAERNAVEAGLKD